MKLAVVALVLPLLAPQEIAWKSDFKATLKEAAASRKLVVLVYQTPDRKDCQRFQNEALADGAVKAALGKYLCVRVHPLGTDDENRLWQSHGEPMPPATLIFEPNGTLLTKVTTLNVKRYAALVGAIEPAYFGKIVPAREALAKDPAQPGPHIALGEAYMEFELPAESAKSYAAAVDQYLVKGDKAKALELLGTQLDKYYEKSWYSPARACCDKLADLDPDNKTGKRPVAAWMKGMAACSEKRWPEAVEILKSACDTYKQHELLPKMMFSLAAAYDGAKDLDQAITVWETIVKDFPGTETAELSQTMATRTREKRQKMNEAK